MKRFVRLLTVIPERLLPGTLREVGRIYQAGVFDSGNGKSSYGLVRRASVEKVVEKEDKNDDHVELPLTPTYFRLKQESYRYQHSAKVFLSHPPFSNWLRSPQHLQNFHLPWNCL